MTDQQQAITTNVTGNVTSDGPAAPQAVKSERKQRISKRMRQVIDLYESGACKTKKAAAERVGLSLSYIYRELKKPHIRVFCEQRARENLALGSLRASSVMTELMECEANGVRFDASKHVLAIAGIKPSNDAQVSVSIDIKAGYVIDLSERVDTFSPKTSLIEANEIKDLGVDGVKDE